jgi:hypothetical protein
MALTDNLIFLAPLQVNSFPATDPIGGLTINAIGSANVQTTSPGPAGHLTVDGDGFTTSVLPAWSYPFTMGLTWRQPSATRPITAMCMRLDASNYFQIYMDSSFGLFARARAGGSAGDATATFSYANDTWYSAIAVFTSSSSRKLFVSGAFGSAETTSIAPSGSTTPGIRIGQNPGDTPSDSVIGFVKYAFLANRAWSLSDCQAYEADPSLIAASGSSGHGRLLASQRNRLVIS